MQSPLDKNNDSMSLESNISHYSLVSVIIPCYNQGHYLAEAINSVLEQNYQPVEIVVVDDGSTDDTRLIAQTYPSVKYVYQNNQGLSAARNTGIDNSYGNFLVFLDSDDWLLPEALEANIKYLQDNPEAVFVAGSHKKVDSKGVIPKIIEPGKTQPYHRLLYSNYIEMIAAVMFRRSVFDLYRYDTSLKSCEDYDFYLRITRDHPIINHTKEIAVYRIHENSLSKNIPLMFYNVLKVLKRQKNKLRGKKEEKYYSAGLKQWKRYYGAMHHWQVKQRLLQNKLIEKKDLALLSGQSSLYLQCLNVSLHLRYLYSKIRRELKFS